MPTITYTCLNKKTNTLNNPHLCFNFFTDNGDIVYLDQINADYDFLYFSHNGIDYKISQNDVKTRIGFNSLHFDIYSENCEEIEG